MDLQLISVIDVAGLTLLAALSVGLWTVRVAVTAAGRRLAAAAVAGVESLVFVVAMGTVLTSLDDPLRVIAYAVGVAGGTLVGMALDERLSTGQSLVQVVLDGDGVEPTALLRARGWPATCSRADGVNGAVAVLHVAVEDRALRRLTADLNRLLPDGFRTVERLREVRPAQLPDGMHQPHAGRARRDAGGEAHPAPVHRLRTARGPLTSVDERWQTACTPEGQHVHHHRRGSA